MYYIKLTMAAVLLLSIVSCQKKFDPNSYKPAMTFGGYAASSEIAASSLVTHFSFENTMLDSVSGTSATPTGTTYTTKGIKGNALSIGLKNYAIFTPTDALKKLQSVTISYWVNTSKNSDGIQTPINFVNSTEFWGNMDMFFDGQTDASSVFKIHGFGSGGAKEGWLTPTLNSPWDKWLHIALTYDAASENLVLYVNGAKVASTVLTGFGNLDFANFPAIVMGTMQFQTNPSLTTNTGAQDWCSYVLGYLDEVRIYNKALGAADVKALYQLENLGK